MLQVRLLRYHMPSLPGLFMISVLETWTQVQVLILIACTGDLYPVTALSPIPHAFLISQHKWYQRLGHPAEEVSRRLVSSNFISYNKQKPLVLCHACQLGKHARLPFVSSSTVISSCFDIIHLDVWTSPILSLSVSDQHAPAIIQNPSVNPNPDSVHHMVTCFRIETNRPTERLNLHVSSIYPLPKSYCDAFNDLNWQNAIRDEYTTLIKNKTWTLVPRASDTNIVQWIFCHKYLANGTLSRYKARLVENGSTQLKGVNLDVKNDFLHGDLSETVYMHQPLGFQDSAHPDYVSEILEKEGPPQDSDFHRLIKECSTKVCEEQKQNIEDTMLELVKICQEKEFLCIHDNVDDLIESALNSKLLLINSNSQRLDKKEQEVKNVVEQPAERGNRNIKSLQNFRIVHKNFISLNISQISSIHAIAPFLSTKEPEHSLSMRYEHLSITLEIESDEVTESNAKNLLPIPSECDVTLEDESKRDVPISENSTVCDNHSNIFFDSKIDDDISVYDDDFEDIEYVEASFSDPEIVSVEEENDVEEENVVNQEEEEVDLEDISQIQDVVLREKILSITCLISNIEYLNDNPTPDHVLNSFKSDNFLLDTFSPEFETFCDHSEETRSGNTTHADNSLPEYDLFCFEIEPDQERLINLMKSNISDDSSNDFLLEEVDLFLASYSSIQPGIENFANDTEGDVRFLEELLIDDSILSHESSYSNFEDNPSISLPSPEPPDKEFNFEIDFGDEISVVRNTIVKFEFDTRVKFDENDYFMFFKVFSFLFAESEDTIFDPGISD
uniref:Ribonuclease H-like domain-containing protein n=1 Tax=Tanacetum cinerariifolium TaxID=118510 RepID=A0A6L2N2T8_TANCI|nr:ribonuclease H-like domain-containing protein [Tanacetum cinerariifolium]